MISKNEILHMRRRLADLPPGKQMPLDAKTLLELCELSLVALFAFKHTDLQNKIFVPRLENSVDLENMGLPEAAGFFRLGQ